MVADASRCRCPASMRTKALMFFSEITVHSGILLLMEHPERKFQTEAASYLRNHLVPPAYFTAIGHGSRGGGGAGLLRGIIAKQMGVKTDLPDLYFRKPLFSNIW